MKTILIIEPRVTELEALMNFCRRSPHDLTVVPARDAQQSMAILQDRQIDLILCATVFPDEDRCRTLAGIARRFPHVPAIGVSDDPARDRAEAEAAGACACFRKPLEEAHLLERIHGLAEASHPGTVQGIPLHSLLQMLENDGQTCTLLVHSEAGEGYIFIEDGTVIDAEIDGQTGEEPFYRQICWDEVIIDIKYYNRQRPRKIKAPLITLIMEGIRRKDEAAAGEPRSLAAARPKPKLQQASMPGMRLALNIGQSLSVEIDPLDCPLDSVLVGMYPDQFLIITTPSHFLVTGMPITRGQTLVVKFTQMDQLFLFRSKICQVVDGPRHLLFLDYPSIIHFHDIRKDERAAASIPCLLKTGDGAVFTGSFRDISSSGALLKVSRKTNERLPDIDIAQRLTLSCTLPDLNESLELFGIVKNFKKDEQGIQIGLEFSTTYPQLEQSLDRYLKSLKLR